MNENKTYGVIGVCGANGNLTARILKQRGYDVVGTDLSFKKDCRFAKSLEGYDIDVFYGKTPESFFKRVDYIIPPLSLPSDSKILKDSGKPIMELLDVIGGIAPEKPVFGITGTNGKTTSTTLLKIWTLRFYSIWTIHFSFCHFSSCKLLISRCDSHLHNFTR